MALKLDSPGFADKAELARYIHPDEMQSDRHAAASAFEMNPADLNATRPCLSVNSLEIEDIYGIANLYRSQFQDNQGRVAVAVHKIIDYVNRGKKAGATLAKVDFVWCFFDSEKNVDAFKHRPPHRTHCGVEFLRSLDELQRRRFGREMAKKPRLHIIEKL